MFYVYMSLDDCLFFLLFLDKIWLFWWRQVGNPVKATNTFIHSQSLLPRLWV